MCSATYSNLLQPPSDTFLTLAHISEYILRVQITGTRVSESYKSSSDGEHLGLKERCTEQDWPVCALYSQPRHGLCESGRGSRRARLVLGELYSTSHTASSASCTKNHFQKGCSLVQRHSEESSMVMTTDQVQKDGTSTRE